MTTETTYKVDPLGDAISSVEALPIEYGDLTVVNAARVSMHKIHTEIDPKRDPGLINYLAKHNHWTPFSHVQVMLRRCMSVSDYIDWCITSADEQFVRVISQKAVMGTNNPSIQFFERGSMYAFLKHGIVTDKMKENCPLSVSAFGLSDARTDGYLDSVFWKEDVSEYLAKPNDEFWTYTFDKPEDINKLKVASFRIKMPIFVARQWYKHQIQFTRNEVSRRYVSDSPEYFYPSGWRLSAENVKQGSSDEEHVHSGAMSMYVEERTRGTDEQYKELMREESICPEQARMILPQSMYTEFVETASYRAYERLVKLRIDPHAQKEVRDYGHAINNAIIF
jgi:thymidylate synthase (FAD)